MVEPRLRDIVMRRERVQDLDAYPFCVPALARFERLTLKAQVCFFVGENGTGKSTLLEAIALAAGFGAEGGSQNFTAHTNSSASAAAPLAAALRLSWTKKVKRGYFLRAESLFNVASVIDTIPDAFDSHGGRSLHAQSHGESFLALFKNRFYPGGIYLLDEPEAAVSPQRQLSMLTMMHDLVESHRDTQFIIATHSPILVGYPDAQIISFDSPDLLELRWDETECVRALSSFMNQREWWLKRLLSPPEES